MRRRAWLRGTAWAIGALVFLAHVYTFPTPRPIRELFAVDIRDAVYHSSMLLLFTLTYRLSIVSAPSTRGAGKRKGRTVQQPAGWFSPVEVATLVVCSGWGALCELSQLFIPARTFSYAELALNMGVPAVIVLIMSVGRVLRER